MFDKRIKIILAGLLFITAIWQFIENNIGNGIFLCLITGIVVGLYFKNEMLLWAFLKLRKQDMQGTSAILDKIKDPEKSLVTKQQGYYNFLKGIISSQTNMNQAEKYLRKAINLGLNLDQDLAMAKLNLAGIAMNKRRKREAQNLITEAKKLDKNGLLKEQIQMMKQQLKRI